MRPSFPNFLLACIATAALAALPGCREESHTVYQGTIAQYDEVALTALGRDVTLWLGDVSGGSSAEIQVRVGGASIATGHLARRGELPFRYEGETYVVVALDYDDGMIFDEGTLRVERRATPTRAPTVRVPQRGGRELAPGLVVVIGDVELGDHTELEVLTADGPVVERREVRAGDVVELEHDGAHYRLIVEAFEDHTTSDDFALLRLEPA